jgi:dTDP-4-amino-4,6-dideoxygalactose transaminase
MMVRARPKYLDVDNLYCDSYQITKNEYFFNKGRTALEFYLTVAKKRLNKSLNILLQDFNCNVVIDAILKSGNNALLTDINLIDFSIDFNTIKENINSIDIIILTHYQGIPNKDYISIIELCKQNNIIVIEDMAHTYKSTIDNVEVGTLGDVSIYSYAFDKPFSCYTGGLLVDNSKIIDIENEYKELDCETDKNAKIDIEMLKLIYKHTQINNYNKNINQYELIRYFISNGISKGIIEFILQKDILMKILRRVVQTKAPNNILRLHKSKISIIKKQIDNFYYQEDIVNSLEQLLLKNGFKIYQNQNSNKIIWNRYSIIDKDKKILNFLLSKNIEIGNFNWSRPLHTRYKKAENIKYLSNFKNSIYASENIINIPIWRKING